MSYLVAILAILIGGSVGWVVGKVIEDKIKSGCPVRILAFRAALFFVCGWFGFSCFGKHGVIVMYVPIVGCLVSGLINRAFDRAFSSVEPISGYDFYGWVAFCSACITGIVVTQIFDAFGWTWTYVVLTAGCVPLAFAAYGVSRMLGMICTVVFLWLLPALADRLTKLGAVVSDFVPCGRKSRRRR